MKVYYFSSMYDGCTYVRCLLPMWANGWNGDRNLLSQHRKSPELASKESLNSDIIVFHRPDTPEHHIAGKLLKSAGKKIVFDNDDTWQLSKGHPFYRLNGKGDKEKVEYKNNLINNFIYNSDLVTTTTEFLADEYRKINPNVVVLPNYIDEKDWDEPLRNETDVVRIGIVGSVAYSIDFHIIKDYLIELDKRKDVQLVLFGLHNTKMRNKNPKITRTYNKEYSFFDKLINLEHAPWVDMIFYNGVLNNLKLDIMLIPRADNYFNKCKSNIKFLEAAMCEVPVIASTFKDKNSPYDKDLDGSNGLLASSLKDWKEKVETLIADKELRRTIGKNAKQYVLNNYNIKDNAYKWKEAYSKLLTN